MSIETQSVLIAAGLYLAFMAAVGWMNRRSARDEAGFYLASRSLGTVLTTSALAGTSIGGSATLLVIGQVYQRGLPFIWTDLAGGAGLILLGLLLAKRVREMGAFSLPEIAGEFYGPTVRRIAAALVLVAEIGFLALLLNGCAGLLQPFLGTPPLVTMGIVAGVFIAYTVIGGQMAVARTDLVQLALMIAGYLFMLGLLLARGDAWNATPPERFAFPVNDAFPPLSLFGLILIAGLPHLVGSDIYAKLLCARDGAVARRAAIIAGALKIGAGLVMGAIGLAAAGLLPAGTPPDQVVTRLFLETLPGPLAGLVVIAFLATLMSSADTVLLTAGTVLSRDILGIRGARGVRAGRLATLAVAAAALALTLWFGTMLSAFIFAYTLFSAALVVPVLLGFWREKLRLTRAGAVAGMIAGAAAVIAGTALRWHADIVTLAGLSLSATVLCAVSLTTRQGKGEQG